jgi:hypothetical protein
MRRAWRCPVGCEERWLPVPPVWSGHRCGRSALTAHPIDCRPTMPGRPLSAPDADCPLNSAFGVTAGRVDRKSLATQRVRLTWHGAELLLEGDK